MCPAARIASNEAERLAELRRLCILDTSDEPAFDSLVRLASHVCGTPIALVSLVDERRQWFKARIGLAVKETPRDVAFCAHAILQEEMLEVVDARFDERFADNPLVTGEPQIRFYAGVPIRSHAGYALGTVCVIDLVPRRLDDNQRWMLQVIAEQVSAQIELKRSLVQAAAALRTLDEERVLLRGVLQAATEYGVIGTTPTGVITVFNRGAERLLGYRASELTGRTTLLLFHDPDEVARRAAEIGASDPFEAFVEAARRGAGERREWTWIRKDGTRLPVALTVTAIRNEVDALIGFIGIGRDLTEEKIAARERQRLADERTARVAADRAVDRLTRLHAAAAALVPLTTPRGVLDIVEQQAIAPVRAALEAFGEEERLFQLALEHLGRQALDRARAYEAEAEAHRAAAAANRAKDEFLAVFSHELRTPLTAVLGWAHMLRTWSIEPTAIDPVRLARGLAVIYKNANALLRSVEAILDVNRIVSGTLELSCKVIDLGAAVRDGVESVNPIADAAGLLLTLSIAPGLPRVNVDPERLLQITNNLMGNAIKFTPPGGRIDVRVDLVDSHLRLTVADSGEGISPEFLPLVFERFRQADSSRTRPHGGLGLGLAIVKHLVELHGGTVTAESEGRGRGATLTVLLPAVEAPARD